MEIAQSRTLQSGRHFDSGLVWSQKLCVNRLENRRSLARVELVAACDANNTGRKSAVPDAVAASKGYATSQQKRKRIEQGFNLAKMVGHIRQVLARGLKKVNQMLMLSMTACNLTRVCPLAQVRPQGAL